MLARSARNAVNSSSDVSGSSGTDGKTANSPPERCVRRSAQGRAARWAAPRPAYHRPGSQQRSRCPHPPPPVPGCPQKAVMGIRAICQSTPQRRNAVVQPDDDPRGSIARSDFCACCIPAPMLAHGVRSNR
ncbi:hypothetical protein DdX_20459 [Ditylenchus destructor]|uniref:Uncharacterized protein n=1 Tax=Ditylenchus destructor TaxID=166010 RepID=A0AAD4MH58_9BILA|nr:hypothetical protein DdX_20459 [Ditylenchus destructor]